mmetsp:Transcript_88266/g.248525  ORF Transcript_88266/g.248525 Transcript_88266/m.248525 type:complete len:203 (+) Transcript_88266:1234-1842(+)
MEPAYLVAYSGGTALPFNVSPASAMALATSASWRRTSSSLCPVRPSSSANSFSICSSSFESSADRLSRAATSDAATLLCSPSASFARTLWLCRCCSREVRKSSTAESGSPTWPAAMAQATSASEQAASPSSAPAPKLGSKANAKASRKCLKADDVRREQTSTTAMSLAARVVLARRAFRFKGALSRAKSARRARTWRRRSRA